MGKKLPKFERTVIENMSDIPTRYYQSADMILTEAYMRGVRIMGFGWLRLTMMRRRGLLERSEHDFTTIWGRSSPLYRLTDAARELVLAEVTP